MSDLQQKTLEHLAARGYHNPDATEAERLQLAARQVAKAIEEIGEAADYITLPCDLDEEDWTDAPFIFSYEIGLDVVDPLAREAFDNAEIWKLTTITDLEAFKKELVDAATPLVFAAGLLDFDLLAAVEEQARANIERGVRGEK